jgi:hypothetical protein
VPVCPVRDISEIATTSPATQAAIFRNMERQHGLIYNCRDPETIKICSPLSVTTSLGYQNYFLLKNVVFWDVALCRSCVDPEDDILHSHLKSYLFSFIIVSYNNYIHKLIFCGFRQSNVKIKILCSIYVLYRPPGHGGGIPIWTISITTLSPHLPRYVLARRRFYW